MMLFEIPYNRAAAVEYANRWAYFRNPEFYDFSAKGGDCTSFASQCLLAGGGVMNFTPTFGWYYIGVNDRAPAWTGVKYLFNFLTNNSGVGPYGRQVELSEVMPGDLCQLILDEDDWQHTPVITAVDGDRPSFETPASRRALLRLQLPPAFKLQNFRGTVYPHRRNPLHAAARAARRTHGLNFFLRKVCLQY